MPNFKGQVTSAGKPIVQVNGKNYQIPQQGVMSARSKLLSSTSGSAMTKQLPPASIAKNLALARLIAEGNADKTKLAKNSGGTNFTDRANTLTPPIANATLGPKTRGFSTVWEKTGGMAQADRDFDKFKPKNVRERENGMRTGVLSDGRKIIVRRDSTDGRPTLEFQDGDKRDKVRYSE
ncbi:hypothetical protein [Noviherbaspirillum sp.]|uniref:hypothetical protein n=1 Tax=Noviherbaspirillum sp. TaxID=1926288 RepID=UPI002FDFE5F3